LEIFVETTPCLENRIKAPPLDLSDTHAPARRLPVANVERRAAARSGVSATLARVAPAVALFFLAPLVGEFLLGNMAIDALPGMIVLAPMYGGAAVLIREMTRRSGRGWPTMLLLGLAYAIFEEGLVIQSLFNPDYFNANLLSTTYIPALGIGVWWTLFVLTLHTVWSTNVPIAIVEALVPERSTIPWLGNIGLFVAGVLLALGAYATYAGTYAVSGYIAPMPQLVGAVAAIGVLIIAAFAMPWRERAPVGDPAPEPWVVGVVSFVFSSLFMVATLLWGRITAETVVVVYLVLYAVAIWLVTMWSRREGWGARHVLALAGGALLTYAWHDIPQQPVLGSTGQTDLIGNAIFAIGALLLLAAAIATQRRYAETLKASPDRAQIVRFPLPLA
jgi:hypothetical protein